jgi:large subunit ribosomal protein L23
MAIFNRTKKNNEAKSVKKEKKAEVVQSAEKPIKSGKKENKSYALLSNPHITEKATYLAEKNQYVFKVKQVANKSEVAKAIESVYGVDVLSVNIINIHPRKRRLGRTMGHVPGYKKAIIKIKEGQKIEVLPQ